MNYVKNVRETGEEVIKVFLAIIMPIYNNFDIKMCSRRQHEFSILVLLFFIKLVKYSFLYIYLKIIHRLTPHRDRVSAVFLTAE